MAMHKKSRKHDTTRGGGGVNLSLIITPMLDMAFQLIAFFIMTYHPPAFEGRIDVNLTLPPKIAMKGPKTPDPKENLLSVDVEPKLNDTLLVTIKAVGAGRVEHGRIDGEPQSLEIQRMEDKTPVTIVGDTSLGKQSFINDLANELDRELKTLLKNPANKSTDIRLRGDANLRHQYLMRFYDVCREAGFEKTHFVVEGP